MFLSTTLLVNTVSCDDETLQMKYDSVKDATVANYHLTGNILTLKIKFAEDSPFKADQFFAAENASSTTVNPVPFDDNTVLCRVEPLYDFCMKDQDFHNAAHAYDLAVLSGVVPEKILAALKKAATSEKIPMTVNEFVSKLTLKSNKLYTEMQNGEFEVLITGNVLSAILNEKGKSKTFFFSGKNAKTTKVYKSPLLILSLDKAGKYSISTPGPTPSPIPAPDAGMGTGAIVGIIFGVIAIIAVLGGVGYYVYINKLKSKQEEVEP